MTKTVVVLDGELKSALAIVRSLGKRGIRVVLGATRKTALSRYSCYTKSFFVYRDPLSSPDLFVQDVVRAAAREDKPVIVTASDATTLLVSRHRDTIGTVATVVLPEQAVVEKAFDKKILLELAASLSVPMPMIHDRASSQIQYPCVVKPRHSATWHNGRGMRGTVRFAHTKKELETVVRTIIEEGGEEPLIESYVQGIECGVEFVCDRGVPTGIVAHRRIRSLSPTGGASVVKETIDPTTYDMLSHALRIVKALSWHGPIMVEFKVDGTTHTPYLMEVNGRFWGSLPLSLFAGVDFPYLFLELLQQDTHTETIHGKTGVISRHVLGDCLHLARVFFARDVMRTYAYPTRRAALRSFLFSKDEHDDVWDRNDPLPFFGEYLDVFLKHI